MSRDEDPPHDAASAKPLDGCAPYRGLERFDEEHAPFFFGREREIHHLLEILRTSRMVCVVGASGCGKSSLVHAGLMPRVRAAGLPGVRNCDVVAIRPGAHPLRALATGLERIGAGPTRVALADDRRTLHRAVSRALAAGAPDGRLMIVVDQLEEVFTLCHDEREREQFFANLVHGAFASGGRSVVVLIVRADFYVRFARYPELAQRTTRSLALVGPMDRDGLRRAITEPAQRRGLRLQPGLADAILDDVGSRAGALALLEHTLLEVWHRRIDDELTLAGYVGAGRVMGALAQRAEHVFSGFTQQQQEIARWVMLELAQPGDGTEDSRRPAMRDELVCTPEPAFDDVLARLEGARLLTTHRDAAGAQVVEMAHEALISGWPRLRGWVDEDRPGLLTQHRLIDAARRWEKLQRAPTALYHGPRLAAARDWATDHIDELGPLEGEFLAASRVAANDELSLLTDEFLTAPPTHAPRESRQLVYASVALVPICVLCLLLVPVWGVRAIAYFALFFVNIPCLIAEGQWQYFIRRRVRITASEVIARTSQPRRFKRSAVHAAPRVRFVEVGDNTAEEVPLMLFVRADGRGLACLDERGWRTEDLRTTCAMLGVAWQDPMEFENRRAVRLAFPRAVPMVDRVFAYGAVAFFADIVVALAVLSTDD